MNPPLPNCFTKKNPTFVIAEIGINHGGDVGVAMDLIESASRTGCDAVKFQTYITEKRLPDKTHALFQLLKQCELPLFHFKELKEYAESQDLIFLSTPFDEESVDFLDEIGVSIYKLASFDVVNKPLLRAIKERKKHVIMSVGMANLEEVRTAVDCLSPDVASLALLHCISAYPTPEASANLNAIEKLRRTFPDNVVGQSDHTSGIRVPLYAVVAGARIIEKHYRTKASMECIDAAVSISEAQMTELVKEIRAVEIMLGTGEVGPKEIEAGTLSFRRHAD